MIMQKILSYIETNGINTVLDIGANIGSFSRVIKLVFPRINILMIEANPFCDNMLKKTGLSYEIACLSDTKKEVKFFLEDTNMIGTGASYYLENTPFYSRENHTMVMTDTLDNLLHSKYNDKTFDFIKIDTQGSEIDIMKGGIKTLNAANHVLLETSLIEYNKGAPLKNDYFDYMNSIGFKPVEMVEEHFADNKLIQEDWIFSRG